MNCIRGISLAALLCFVACSTANETKPPEEKPHILPQTTPSPAKASVNNVHIPVKVFNPHRDEQMRLSFLPAGAAEFLISVWDADGGLINRWTVEAAGESERVTTVWDGRDLLGTIVPDEAYTFTIADPTGQILYNPFAISGGERIDITEADILLEENRISYRLPYPCRMLVRAGAKPGPLHKTIVDWEPRTAGQVNEVWNGLDDSGNLYVPRLKDFLITISGYKLPDTTVITRGNDAETMLVYRKKHTPTETISVSRDGAPALHRQFGRAHAALKIPTLYVEDMKGTAPKVIEIDEESSIKLRFSLDRELGPVFLKERFEIMYFMDNQMFMEEGQAYMPYTFELKGSYVPEGKHLFTINVGNFSNQFMSYSITVVKGEAK